MLYVDPANVLSPFLQKYFKSCYRGVACSLFVRNNQITQTSTVLPAPVQEDRLWSA